MMDLDDLAAVDKINAQVMADSDHWKLVAKATALDLFFDGQTVDTILRAI